MTAIQNRTPRKEPIMLDQLTKLIPFIHQYPVYFQWIVVGWFAVGAFLVGGLILIPQTQVQKQILPPTPPIAATQKSQGGPSPIVIDQQTKGNNSPAISGVKGDVNIHIKNENPNGE